MRRRRISRGCRLVMGGAFALVAACSGGDEGATEYGPDVRADFIDECTDDGAAENVCGCLYDRIEDDLPFERFTEFEDELRSGVREIPAEIQDMAVACAAEPGG